MTAPVLGQKGGWRMSRRPHMPVALLRAALILAIAGVAGPPGTAAAVEVGARAPDFTLPSTTGGKIALSQFQGKKLVLLEFYGSDTSPT